MNNFVKKEILKISMLIPCTSNGRPEWKSIKDTYLYNYTLKTFLITQDRENEYHFYIGYDNDDRLFSFENEQNTIKKISNVFQNIHFHFIPLTIKKGYVTKMWNVLYKKAYDDNCDYFFQCGDDINFKTKGWINDSISILKKNNNIGISGPINNNTRILTQAMFSRKHMEIFGFMFPEEIKNWCCDDWYNLLYKPNHFFPLTNHYCSNDGGNPRYNIDGDKRFLIKNTRGKIINLRKKTSILCNKHKEILKKYLNKL